MKSQIHEHQNQNSKKMSVKINFKTRLIGIAILILLITGLTTSCKKSTCTYVPCTVRDSINISTGIGKNGTIDPNWKVISSPYLTAQQPIIMPPWPGYEITPIVNTNAGWINCTGAACCASLLGNYTYETAFTITPNTLSFSCDFGIAYDDALVAGSLVLEDPSGNITTLTEPSHAPIPLEKLGPNIGTVITNPAVGSWKIRATITTVDHGTGLLLSGYIKTLKPC